MPSSLADTVEPGPAAWLLQLALAHPGQVLELPPAPTVRPTDPRHARTRLSPAMSAVLHALSDHETPLRLALTTAAEADPAIWQTPPGASAMLLIEVPALIADPPSGVGDPEDPDLTPRLCIAGLRHLGVAGIARHFWRRRPEAEPLAPAVDLVLCSGHRLAAIRRQAHVRICA